MLRTPALILVGALAAPLLAQPAPPSVGQPSATPAATLLSISVDGKVARPPDVADLAAGVVTQATTATQAMRENAERMAAVVAALRRAGIAERDLQTAGINLSPQYRYAENQPPQLVGYQAVNTLNVRVRALGNMGRAIDTLVAQGANQINGPNFRLENPDAALDAARLEAMAKARSRAALYASAAGLRVKRIAAISEASGVMPPPYPVPMRAQAEMAAKNDTPVAPGEVETQVTLNVQFELE